MNNMKLITTFEELNEFVEKVIASNIKVIGLDLEGEFNLHRYGIHLCLIQISFNGEPYIIDPVSIEDITPIKRILENEDIEKVIYSCNIDVRLLKYTKDINMKNIFDIRLAASTLHFTETGLSKLIENFLDITMEKDKKCQLSNWNKRPLTEAQLNYACNDVIYLVPLMEILRKELIDTKFLKQFTHSCKKLEKEVFKEKKDKHTHVPDYNRLSRNERVFLKHYYNARENAAMKLDYPPFWIMSKEDLVAMAKSPLYTKEDWLKKSIIPERARSVLDLFIEAAHAALKEINV